MRYILLPLIILSILFIGCNGDGDTSAPTISPNTTPTPTTTSADEVVTFPDPKLEKVIREAIDKPQGDIFLSELEQLTKLDDFGGGSIDDPGIDDLTGIQYCTNLTTLSLHRNLNLTDISPLSNLTYLTELSLAGNFGLDISPLANLTNLSMLHLYGNNSLSNISPLANLKGLTNVSLWIPEATDISALSSLTNLTTLFIGGDKISDISPLANLTNLTELYLSLRQLDDITPLSNLINLTVLNLAENQIVDITPLSNLTNLSDVNLTFNLISDISPLVDNLGINNGDTLSLAGNPISETSVDECLPVLQERGVVTYWYPTSSQIETIDGVIGIMSGVARYDHLGPVDEIIGSTLLKGIPLFIVPNDTVDRMKLDMSGSWNQILELMNEIESEPNTYCIVTDVDGSFSVTVSPGSYYVCAMSTSNWSRSSDWRRDWSSNWNSFTSNVIDVEPDKEVGMLMRCSPWGCGGLFQYLKELPKTS